jgi:spermidine synthase
MSESIRELDYQRTELGELVLRRRKSLAVPDAVVYEVKLNDEFLMSSLVNESEKALARLALDAAGDHACDVLLGGLGLGYTAVEALTYKKVRRLTIVEYLQPVIGWHRRGLVPAAALLEDPRCHMMQGDFFDCVSGAPDTPLRYEIILVDIDHSPESLLHPRHATFYTRQGLERLTEHLKPPGIFALWSAGEPSNAFMEAMLSVFSRVDSQEIAFFNPHFGIQESNWIIMGRVNPEQ